MFRMVEQMLITQHIQLVGIVEMLQLRAMDIQVHLSLHSVATTRLEQQNIM